MTNDGRGTYRETFDDLRNVYLEDSWALSVAAEPRSLSFVLDAVLTPDHPDCRQPASREQHCYRRAILLLTSDDLIEFEPSNGPAAHDATGEADYGNIDTFIPIDWQGGAAWELTGDWGAAQANRPTVVLTWAV